MNKNLRAAVIAGNWKMNKTRPEAKALVEELKPLVKDADCGVVVCVPFTNLETVLEAAKGSNIKVGAQNCHFEKSGAFTGETDITVNKRTIAALEAGLNVILCVGEMLEDRELGITEELVAMQTKIALNGVDKADLAKVIIAYEPVWAIGTGKTATAEQANEVCSVIRNTVAKIYDQAAADAMTIQYGGSMNAKNAEELLAQPDVDGGLIGGASLKAPDFSVIVNAASK